MGGGVPGSVLHQKPWPQSLPLQSLIIIPAKAYAFDLQYVQTWGGGGEVCQPFMYIKSCVLTTATAAATVLAIPSSPKTPHAFHQQGNTREVGMGGGVSAVLFSAKQNHSHCRCRCTRHLLHKNLHLLPAGWARSWGGGRILFCCSSRACDMTTLLQNLLAILSFTNTPTPFTCRATHGGLRRRGGGGASCSVLNTTQDKATVTTAADVLAIFSKEAHALDLQGGEDTGVGLGLGVGVGGSAFAAQTT